MNNFMVADITSALIAFTYWLLCSFTQGYVIGYLSNVLSFRTASLGKQFCLSTILALSIMPTINYFLAKTAGIAIAAHLALALSVFSIVLLCLHRKSTFRKLKWLAKHWSAYRFFVACTLAWIIYALLMPIDWQWHKNLYLSEINMDYAKHVTVANAILRDGLPPASPFFHPGQSIPIGYYYYWHLSAAIISLLSGSLNDARAAVFGGTMWTGIAFLCMLSFCLRYFSIANRPVKQLTKISFFLLPICNINLIPCLPYLFVAWRKHYPLGALTWWSFDNIMPPLLTMLWVPQHMAALISGLFASICFLELSKEQKISQRIWLTILAAIAMSSCFGCSTYVAIGFMFIWLAWMIFLITRKRREVVYLCIACMIGFLLSLPFFLELKAGHPGSIPLIFAVRRFDWLDVFLPHSTPVAILYFFHFIFLPLTYFFGLGALFFTTLIYLRKTAWQKMPAKELFLLIMFIVSLLLGTFVRSTIRANDFGWRVFLMAQFVAIIWGARVIFDLYFTNKKKLFWSDYSIVYL